MKAILILLILTASLARPQYSPKHVTADFYYKIPVRPIYKTYPVYHPDRAPAGDIDWLNQQEPQEIWHFSPPKSEEDWIRAGEVVFDAPIFYRALGIRPPTPIPYLHEKAGYDKVQPPLTGEGILPVYRYDIRKKGEIDIGILACAMCHTRVMPDGSVIKGAPGNFPFDHAMAEDFPTAADVPPLLVLKKKLLRSLYFVPWLSPEIADPAVTPAA